MNHWLQLCAAIQEEEIPQFPCGHPKDEHNSYPVSHWIKGKLFNYTRCRICKNELQRAYKAKRENDHLANAA